MTSPTNPTITELATRVEEATGPDRELDILIWAVVNDLPVVWDGNSLYATTNMLLGWIDPGEYSRNFTPLGNAESRPLYTASLDAAMQLVPSDHCGQIQFGKHPGAWVAPLDDDSPADFNVAATPALALTAACLRALSQKGDE